jgi:hypothetical protein
MMRQSFRAAALPSQQCMSLPWKGLLCAAVIVALAVVSNAQNVYDWMPYDAFDDIDDRMHAITAQNCKTKPASELRLPYESVGQLPKFNRLLSFIVYPNRTKLLHVHNTALNRAFFFRYESLFGIKLQWNYSFDS